MDESLWETPLLVLVPYMHSFKAFVLEGADQSSIFILSAWRSIDAGRVGNCMRLRSPSLSAEVFAVYTMVVSCHTFAAHLLEMKAPTVPDKSDSADPDSSWPYHKDNLNAISESLVNIVSSSIDEAGTNYQCSYCGRSWHSKADKHKQRPKVSLRAFPVPYSLFCTRPLIE